MSSELGSEAAFEGTNLGFLYRQFTKPKPLPTGIDLRDQVAVVTGSNVGIGLAACRQLLQLGLSGLIMGVRSQAKGDEAARQLRAQFPASTIEVWLLDMESYESIREFVGWCTSLPRIDMTILNAALMKTSYSVVSATEHETAIQVNYLSTALLSISLLPVLKAKRAVGSGAKPPVLCIVGSDLAWRVDVNTKGPILQQFDTPAADNYDGMLWYGRSKFLLVFFMAKLAEFVDPDDVIINMPNPGTTKGTAFHREYSPVMAIVIAVLQFLAARTVDVGASTYLDACISRGRESHGSFLSDWAIKPYPSLWYTPEGQEFKERLWEETMGELKQINADVVHNLIGPRQ